MANIQIHLPPFNGNIQVGLAANTDLSLPAAERLVVVIKGDAHESGLFTAAATLATMPAQMSQEGRSIVANAAYSCIAFGLTGKIGDNPNDARGGDYRALPPEAVTQDQINAAEALISEQGIVISLTLMLATKLNWWTTNHHTGQGELSPYIVKVTSSICPNWIDQELRKWMHAIGHWCSTHRMLLMLGIATPAEFHPLVDDGIIDSPTISQDVVLRTSAMPAGTARHSISSAIIKRHAGNKIFMFSTKVQDMVNLHAEVEAVFNAGKANVALVLADDDAALDLDPRVPYHIGAGFLTDHAQERIEFNSPELTGHLGSVVFHLYRGSTLARSPHVGKAVGNRLDPMYSSSDCFSQDWDDRCSALGNAMIVASSDVINRVCGAADAGRANEDAWVALQVALGVYPDAATARAAWHAEDANFGAQGGAPGGAGGPGAGGAQAGAQGGAQGGAQNAPPGAPPGGAGAPGGNAPGGPAAV